MRTDLSGSVLQPSIVNKLTNASPSIINRESLKKTITKKSIRWTWIRMSSVLLPVDVTIITISSHGEFEIGRLQPLFQRKIWVESA
jgi:hypothetical protein